jgi:hypothetical protein
MGPVPLPGQVAAQKRTETGIRQIYAEKPDWLLKKNGHWV